MPAVRGTICPISLLQKAIEIREAQALRCLLLFGEGLASARYSAECEGRTLLPVGRRIGRYELVRRVGRGGRGEVWDAVLHGPLGFRRQVALKLLQRGPVDRETQEALVREARTGALMSHPNVVSIHELSEWQGTWFFAMELVRGPPLTALSAAPMPPGCLVELGIHASAGLAHIHAHTSLAGEPLVHRDIKPGNLLLDRSGLVKVSNLSVAGWAGDSVTSAADTLGYAAPEQLVGRAEPRSDLFSLGVTLYRLCAGAMPFAKEASSAEICAALADGAVMTSIEERAPELAPVIARCLQPDPEDRFDSAMALGAALRALRGTFPADPTLVDLLAARRGDRLPSDIGGASPNTATAARVRTNHNVPGRAQPPRS